MRDPVQPMATRKKKSARSTKRSDGRSKKRPGTDTQRDLIVDAAVDLFIEHGSASVSVSEICARADIGRQTFYRCFTDKDALIAYLYQHAINAHIESAVARLPGEGSDAEWVYQMIDQVIDGILERHKLARLLYVEASNPNSEAYIVVDRAMDRAARAIQSWFAATLGRRPSKTYLKSILSATTWLVHDAIIAGRTKRAVAEAKRASRELFAGVYLTTTRTAALSATSRRSRR